MLWQERITNVYRPIYRRLGRFADPIGGMTAVAMPFAYLFGVLMLLPALNSGRGWRSVWCFVPLVVCALLIPLWWLNGEQPSKRS